MIDQTRVDVPLPKAYRLLNHGPVTLVSSAWREQRNVMAAAWVMPLDFDPPKVAVVIDKNTYTRELVEASGEFALNVPTRRLAQATHAAGSCSGREHDKFTELRLASFSGRAVAAPLLCECVGWLECRIIPEPALATRYDLFLAEVLAAWADPRVFREGRWNFCDENLRTLHHVAGGFFFATGEPVDA